jgi:hypothetical protein
MQSASTRVYAYRTRDTEIICKFLFKRDSFFPQYELTRLKNAAYGLVDLRLY